MIARLAALLLYLAAAAPAAAQQVVTSPGPEAVSVTVYRDPRGSREMNLSWLGGYAFITETRTVSLPAGDSVIRFEGVAGNILPASAIIRGLPRMVAEKNHDARLLSAGALVDAFLGRQVHIRRTDRATGRTTESEAIIRSGPDGIVLQTSEGIEALSCSGMPERLVYSEVPPGLSDKPTLAVTTSSAEPVTATLTLSYLAGQFDWRANYVAGMAPDGHTLDLFAWLTLANANDESFVGAGAQVVAGAPNRVEEDKDGEGPDYDDEGNVRARPASPEIRLQCWPSQTTSDLPYQAVPEGVLGKYAMRGADIVVTGTRISRPNYSSTSPVTVLSAGLEQLGDLKLYRIPEPVTVAAHSQKQIALLHKEGVKFERLYGVELDASEEPDEDDEPTPVWNLLRTKNVEARGLGLPLPSGSIAFFEQAAGRPMLVGEPWIRDTAVGQDLELYVGRSIDLSVRRRILRGPGAAEDEDKDEDEDAPRTFEVVISNAAASPKLVELLLYQRDRDYHLVRPSRKLREKYGWPLWRARVPANGSVRLTYVMEYDPAPDSED
jgi:hypothetical protein